MRLNKIVHLTSVHGPFDDRIFLKECRSLVGAGYDVTVVAPHKRDELVNGVRIKAVRRLEGRLARMTLTVWSVYREAVRENAELYHFHDAELIPVGLLLRFRGNKVIYDIHEDLPRDMLSKYYVPSWLRHPLAALTEWVEDFACRRFSALMPATPAIGERFQALNENCIVVQNYPLLHELEPPTQVAWYQREPSVAYLGGITRERGIREMVRAMELLPEGLRAVLKLAGAFSSADVLQEVARLPGWRRVEPLGVLDRTSVAQMLGQVRAGLVICHPEPGFIQSQPIKLFEYMSAGIPVIASDFPLWRQIVQGANCGLLVNPLNAEAIGQAIEYLLTHPAEAEAMGRRGRKAVEELYHWATEEGKLLECYASLQTLA